MTIIRSSEDYLDERKHSNHPTHTKRYTHTHTHTHTEFLMLVFLLYSTVFMSNDTNGGFDGYFILL